MEQSSAQFSPTPPVFTQEQVIPKPPKKSFPKWPFVVIICFFIGFGLGVIYGKFQPTRLDLAGPSPSLNSSPTILPTPSPAIWKTFSGEIFKYKYPANLYLSESSLTDNRALYQDKASAGQTENCQKNQLGTAQNPCPAPLIEVLVSMTSDFSQIPTTDLYIEYTNPQGLKFLKNKEATGGLGQSIVLEAYLTEGTTLYKITLQTSPQGYADWEILNQILSTFNFTQPQSNQSDPLTVAQEYLDAYIAKDWQTTKKLCGDSQFDENTAAAYGLVKYEITGSKADTDPKYFHVYIKLTNQSGTVFDKSPTSSEPLQVLMSKNNDGNWRALTWYFFQ